MKDKINSLLCIGVINKLKSEEQCENCEHKNMSRDVIYLYKIKGVICV